MLQISYIRQQTERVKERLGVKHFSDLSIVDSIISLEEQVRILKVESETLQAKLNATSKEIGILMGKGEKELAEQKRREVSLHKTAVQQLNEQLSVAERKLQDELVKLPNLPHSSVPKGRTPEENVVVREAGNKPTLYAGAVPHWELIKKDDCLHTLFPKRSWQLWCRCTRIKQSTPV